MENPFTQALALGNKVKKAIGPSITIDCASSRLDPHGDSNAFTVKWADDEFRYHVWIGLRPYSEGKVAPYPVLIDGTIYKNTIAEVRGYNTLKKDLNAKANASIKAAIKEAATYGKLIALFNAKRDAIEASDKMRAEADRLNAIFDAYRLLLSTDTDTKEMMYVHAYHAHIR